MAEDEERAEQFDDTDVHINTFSIWASFDSSQAVDELVDEFGEEALSKVVRVYCAIASQQTRKPYCIWDVGRGFASLARRCRFGDADECERFVRRMADVGLVGMDETLLWSDQILSDWCKVRARAESSWQANQAKKRGADRKTGRKTDR